jgi:hypothetical protein
MRTPYLRSFYVGQRIHCILHGGVDGIIYEIKGEQSPESCRTFAGGVGVMGGRATLSIVFPDHESHVPESLVRSSVQWEVLDEIPASSEEIADARKRVVGIKAEAAHQAGLKAMQEAQERLDIARDNPHLKQLKANPTKTRWAIGSANIRTELAKAFPGIKFAVRSSSYSGGCSIDIAWTDGPTTEQVEEISKKYQTCGFDGMQDLEYRLDNVWPDIFGGANYVHTQREVSAVHLREVVAYFGWGDVVKVDDNGYVHGSDYEKCQAVNRESWTRSYMPVNA